MRVYTRFRSSKGKPPPHSGWYWVAAVGGVAFLGWVFWQTQSKEPVVDKREKNKSAQIIHSAPARPAKPIGTTITIPPPLPTSLTNRFTNSAGSGPYPPQTASRPPIAASATNLEVANVPPLIPDAGLKVQSVLDAQVALYREGIASGSIDGSLGSQTRAALEVFQKIHGLPVTGALDEATKRRLVLEAPPVTNYVVTAADLGRLRPLSKTWMGKSQQDRLDFETILELVAEKGHAHPREIRLLNPGVDWDRVYAGQVLKIPASDYPVPKEKAAFLRIYLNRRVLEAYDAETNVMAHFPVSIARRVEKRPVGELHVQTVATRPNYVFNPDIFPESAEAKTIGRKLVLPPGPNNPVGLVWIGLDRSGYGIHGTPKPEEVGRTESHGCFRLANWNAEFLVKLVWVGMPVWVEP